MNTYWRLGQTAAVFALLCLSVPFAKAEPQGLDFDGDGLSDLVGYEIQHDGSANEIALTYQESASATVFRKEFGKSTESAVPADYDGDGVTDQAVVGPDEQNQLVWRMRLSGQEGAISSSIFGQLGGTILSGCSFDSDHIADRAIFFQGQFISIELSSDLSLRTLDLGVSDIELLTCGDVNGDGRNDLVGYKKSTAPSRRAMRTARARAPAAIFYAWDVETQSRFLEERFGNAVASILTADVDGDGTREIGYVKRKRNAARQIQFLLNGQAFTVNLPKFLSATAGRFDATAGSAEGLLVKAASDDAFFKIPSLATPAVFEHIILNDTEDVMSGVNFIKPGPLMSDEAACQVHHEPVDGLEGFLWKPTSDTNGKAVVVLPREQRLKKVRVVKNGQNLESLYYGGNANGGRDHWRSRYSASFFDSNVTVMGESSGVIHCWLIKDPRTRYD